ncbi:hypothetical protein TNCV_4852341 [Trichonephila clavipes]|nr:hypothetical protein TNCV_4852341 [Trichonephila clavipes]
MVMLQNSVYSSSPIALVFLNLLSLREDSTVEFEDSERLARLSIVMPPQRRKRVEAVEEPKANNKRQRMYNRWVVILKFLKTEVADNFLLLLTLALWCFACTYNYDYWSFGLPIPNNEHGHSSLVVKVSDRGWHVMSSSSEPLKTHRVGEQCTLNLLRAQT